MVADSLIWVAGLRLEAPQISHAFASKQSELWSLFAITASADRMLNPVFLHVACNSEYVYMMPLPGVGELCCADDRQSPTHAISTSHDPQLNVPVSFMQMGEDHLLMTYYNATARRNHAQFLAAIQEHLNTAGIDPFRLAAVNTVPGSGKCPRLISFAPWLEHQS